MFNLTNTLADGRATQEEGPLPAHVEELKEIPPQKLPDLNWKAQIVPLFKDHKEIYRRVMSSIKHLKQINQRTDYTAEINMPKAPYGALQAK